MHLTRWEPAQFVEQVLPRQTRRILNAQPGDHLRDDRSADERRRASISEKSSLFYSPFAHAQRKSQSVAADRVRFFDDHAWIGQFAGIARMSQMIFEDLGIHLRDRSRRIEPARSVSSSQFDGDLSARSPK